MSRGARAQCHILCKYRTSPSIVRRTPWSAARLRSKETVLIGTERVAEPARILDFNAPLRFQCAHRCRSTVPWGGLSRSWTTMARGVSHRNGGAADPEAFPGPQAV